MEVLDILKNKYKANLKSKLPIQIEGVTRNDLALLFAEAGFSVGAEIGVEQGIYSEILCKSIPNLKLHCVDSWVAHADYRDHITQSKFDGFLEETKKRLAPFDVSIHRGFSADIVEQFTDDSLDFVYIDANHNYENVIEDITLWNKKVRVGGVISGHDYIKRTRPVTQRVVEAVNDYTKANGIDQWFVFGTKLKKEGVPRDRARSWMWIKK